MEQHSFLLELEAENLDILWAAACVDCLDFMHRNDGRLSRQAAEKHWSSFCKTLKEVLVPDRVIEGPSYYCARLLDGYTVDRLASEVSRLYPRSLAVEAMILGILNEEEGINLILEESMDDLTWFPPIMHEAEVIMQEEFQEIPEKSPWERSFQSYVNSGSWSMS